MARRQDYLPAVRQGRDQGITPFGAGLLAPASFFSASPMQLARRMQEDFDRLFSLAVGGPDTASAGTSAQLWAPTVDISQDNKEWRIEADLPGVKQDDIDIQVENGALVIRAELKPEEEPQQAPDQNGNGQQSQSSQSSQRQYYHRERRYGFFERVIALPPDVDDEQIQADFNNGVLVVHIPKADPSASRGRRISVQGRQQSALTSGEQPSNGQSSGSQQADSQAQQNANPAETAGRA